MEGLEVLFSRYRNRMWSKWCDIPHRRCFSWFAAPNPFSEGAALHHITDDLWPQNLYQCFHVEFDYPGWEGYKIVICWYTVMISEAATEIVPNRPGSSRIIPNRPESSRIVANRPESSRIVPNRPESPRIVPNLPEPPRTAPNRPKSSRIVQISIK